MGAQTADTFSEDAGCVMASICMQPEPNVRFRRERFQTIQLRVPKNLT